MKRLSLTLAALLLAALAAAGQTTSDEKGDELQSQRESLLSDLRALEAKTEKLDKPLALAAAKAEIAEAAWGLDAEWAKRLLREAFALTLPPEEERGRMRGTPAGTLPQPPAALDRARGAARSRVMDVARRDKAFAEELARHAAETLGKYEEHIRYADLAKRALGEGDRKAAGDYLLRSLDADPSIITAGFTIRDIAAQDRAAGDRLIIQYIERLRAFPVSLNDQSLLRSFFVLVKLVFPEADTASRAQGVTPPGPAVMRAYARYMLETLSAVEQQRPGFVKGARGILMTTWVPVSRHAPELVGDFRRLEQLSATPGQGSALPEVGFGESSRASYERRLKEALASDHPDETSVAYAVSGGEFERARKMLDKLPDSPRKRELTEQLNTREALSLAKAGDALRAERVAAQLDDAHSIAQVYPAIIAKCVADKDRVCAGVLVLKAVKQLRAASAEPPAPPAGLPASLVVTRKELDPALVGLLKLAASVQPLDESLALQVLDEFVSAANESVMETDSGRTALDAAVLKKLSAKNEERVLQAAAGFKDNLRQIVVEAAVLQRRADELASKSKAASEKAAPEKAAQ